MTLTSRLRKSIALISAGALVAAGLLMIDQPQPASAQWVAGDAPFINTWAVAGPFDTAVGDEVYGTDRPADGNWARWATASASSTWKTAAVDYPTGTDSATAVASRAIDGDSATEWASQMHNTGGDPATWPAWDPSPALTLTFDNPIEVKTIKVFDRHNAAWQPNTSDVQRVDYTLKNAAGAPIGTGSITGLDPLGVNPGVKTLTTAVQNVASVELLIVHDGQKLLKNVGLGFKEVQVFDSLGEQSPTAGDITPEIGQTFEGKTWEYFDDRVWNRNYDDYQDLHGYYAIKKGVDTRNKYVYAASYVYSATAQDVELRYGSSGSHRAFVNDEPVDERSTPSEVQKDMTKTPVHLVAGWNKILLQIKHAYTDDKNANGYPIAKDASVAYLGFYARLTTSSGSTVSGLTYSVTGDGSSLAIDTRGLSATDVVNDNARGRGLPENVMPGGYRDWPYVWNTSNYTTPHGVQASHFRFLARGGQPGYTWSISSGSLPAGLALDPNGTITGTVTAAPGTYSFTVRVTDASSASATKALSITIKERPNRWLELGKVSALSHSIATYEWWADPNFSADRWAERAKRQGHAMVSVESLQTSYYWPSRFADPQHEWNQYSPTDANGKIVDALKAYEEAVKRYGMKFGLYYATEGGKQEHYSSDVFVQNVQDLILRYDPAYLYFDGPQKMPWANYDAMYSIVRNYGDDIIVQSNAWSNEFGDPDLRTEEASAYYGDGVGSNLTKRTVNEPWKIAVTKYNPNPFYPRRDDYRLLARETIANVGRGNIDNLDQTPIMLRGPNQSSPTTVATDYPKGAQEYIDMRDDTAAWWAPAGKPDRHESITGTMPYTLSPAPAWGYAVSRDNNVYLHLMQGPAGKTGYAGNEPNGLAAPTLTVGPITGTVTKVTWLNEGANLTYTTSGTNLTINLAGITQRDPVSTIIKVETNNGSNSYPLTNLVATGTQLTPSTLKVEAEGYRTLPALKAPFGTGDVTFASSASGVASVNSSTGVVTAVSNGTATITASGTYEGVTKTDTIDVKVASGKVYVKDTMIGAALWVAGHEAFGELSSYEAADFRLEGRSLGGGPIGLDAATVTMKAGIVNLAGATATNTMPITESTSVVTFANGKVIPKPVSTPTRIAVWGEVTLDGTTTTTNRVFLDLLPSRNVAPQATVTASGSIGSFTADKVVDGKTITGTSFDNSKWSVSGSGASWLSFKLAGPTNVQNIEVVYNMNAEAYINTPKPMEIQTSSNGTTWTTLSTVTPPAVGSGAFFGYGVKYPAATKTRYVRLNFPTGGNSAALDIQEVRINGTAAPTLHWKLDETTGTTAADSSGNANAGTVAGTSTWATGKLAGALDLDGTSGRVTAASLPTVATDNVTMSAWIKWDGSTSADQIVAYNGNTATNGYGIMLRASNSNRLTILLGGVAFVASSVTPTVGEWTLVTATRRSGTWRLYVNGENVNVTSSGSTPNGPGGAFRVGAIPQGAAGFFNGAVDDVKVWESALTDDEIRAEYRAG